MCHTQSQKFLAQSGAKLINGWARNMGSPVVPILKWLKEKCNSSINAKINTRAADVKHLNDSVSISV